MRGKEIQGKHKTEVLHRRRPRLLGSDVQPTFQHQAAHSSIRADAAQLDQVIANLAINVRDAMPAGGSLTISTRNECFLTCGSINKRRWAQAIRLGGPGSE
jgi:signal transduction histidine kinase